MYSGSRVHLFPEWRFNRVFAVPAFITSLRFNLMPGTLNT
jgi:hypothetical protein